VTELHRELSESQDKIDNLREYANAVNTNLNHLFKEMFEHVSTVNDGVRERIDKVVRYSEQVLLQRLNPLHRSFELQRTQLAIKRKILLLGTPGHSNIGDAAIAAGEYEFIKRYFPEYTLIEIDAYHMDEQYIFLQSVVGSDDLIFIHGGGNLGDLYPAEELLRRRIINDFPNNRIVILPQTVYFGNTEQSKHELSVSSEVYNRHKDLILFTRGASSLDFVREHFGNVKSFDSLDMAMLLRREFNFEREGILTCIRDANDESGIDDDTRKDIYAVVAQFDEHFEKTNNLYEQNISSQMRNLAINEELKKFARHKIAVTDRLHGMLFAVITKTPCVAISAKTQKIREFYAHFTDSNAVFFIDKDISALKTAIESALAVKTPEYPVLKRSLFDEMCRTIRSEGMQNG
jgi:pyruvyl transferase EpsI